MYQQRIQDKRVELDRAKQTVRAARKLLVDAESRDCVSGAELIHHQTGLTRAEEEAFWLAAELQALEELQAEHLKTKRMTLR